MADIYLDNIRFSDVFALYRMAKDPKFFYRALNDRHAWIAWRVTRYIVKATLDKFLGRRVKVVRNKASKELIGCIVLLDLNKKPQKPADIGFFIASKYQGQGIGTAAVLRFVDWGIEKLKLNGIEATANPENISSVRLLEKIGLKRIGFISAAEGNYFSRDGKREARIAFQGDRDSIKSALKSAQDHGLYSPSISVF